MPNTNTVPLAPLRHRPRRARSAGHNRHGPSRDQRAARRGIPDQDGPRQVIAGALPGYEQRPSTNLAGGIRPQRLGVI